MTIVNTDTVDVSIRCEMIDDQYSKYQFIHRIQTVTFVQLRDIWSCDCYIDEDYYTRSIRIAVRCRKLLVPGIESLLRGITNNPSYLVNYVVEGEVDNSITHPTTQPVQLVPEGIEYSQDTIDDPAAHISRKRVINIDIK